MDFWMDFYEMFVVLLLYHCEIMGFDDVLKCVLSHGNRMTWGVFHLLESSIDLI